MRLIAIDAGKVGIGDQICYEPTIRALTNLWADDDIRVLANDPCIFSHLPVTAATTPEDLLKGQTPDLVIPCSPFRINREKGCIETHPFATFATPSFIHTVDFTSMFVLHRMLTDAEKRPLLPVTNAAREALADVLNPYDASDLTLVHLGSSDGDDRFIPVEYQQELIDRLLKLGHQVAVFGASSHGPIAQVDLRDGKVLDLVDKLDLPLLFALIQKAKLLITNDSCPVHIAGAFNQPILLLPTLKHPDHTLHVRYGSRYWQAIAVYNKVALETVSLEPDQLLNYGSMRFKKIKDYLPDLDSVLDAVDNLIYVES